MTQANSAAAPVRLRSLFPRGVLVGASDIEVRHAAHEPEQCQDGSVFVADLAGDQGGDATAQQAIRCGASAIITERFLPVAVPQCLVADARQAYAQLCHALAGQPSQRLLTIGVLGSHGKTSAGLLVASMLKSILGRVAYRTSLGWGDGQKTGGPEGGSAAACAHPAADGLYHWLESAVQHDAGAAVVELEPSMLLSQQADGMQFDLLLVPSLRRCQKLSAAAFRQQQRMLDKVCQQLKPHGLLVHNADDAPLVQWLASTQPSLSTISYALHAEADVRGSLLESYPGGQQLMISAGHCLSPLTSSLIGQHHSRHMLAAAAVGWAFGLDLHEVLGGIGRLQRIPGHLEPVVRGQDFQVLVDQADTPDRLAVALHAVRSHRYGPVTAVVDLPQRCSLAHAEQFGRMLERGAQRVILTATHGQGVPPTKAMWRLMDGFESPAAVHVIPNRQTAIELALHSAEPGSCLLLAGCGTRSWSWTDTAWTDRQLVEQILQQRTTPAQSRPQPSPAANQPRRSHNLRVVG
jgi:UDP-N-acetylmuramoyl-L-alanyl-D-glutamate--2,6-diaminopimelate ligase